MRLRKQHGVLLGVHLELRIELTPDELHVVPVLHDAVLHGILQGEDAPKLLGTFT